MDKPNEIEFYNFIIGVTKYYNSESSLRKDCQSIFDLIIKDYKKNIHLAASKGLNEAYICIYEIGANYKDSIPIDEFIRMTPNIIEKFETFKIEPIIDKIKKRLFPFIIEVKSLDETNNFIGITVSWETGK